MQHSFITEVLDTYSTLPNVTFTHRSDGYVILSLSDHPEDCIHISTFDPHHFQIPTIYYITRQGYPSYATTSRHDALRDLNRTYLSIADPED